MSATDAKRKGVTDKKALSDEMCVYVNRLWRWLGPHDQVCFLYEFPDMAGWLKEACGNEHEGK